VEWQAVYVQEILATASCSDTNRYAWSMF